MDSGLVSILSPCYNEEKYVSAFLQSVLNQTYPAIELILVDDGSTDRTKEIVQSYQPRFARKGYSLIYLYQENAGQAAAINKGLKVFRGEYLKWVDSDDILLSENVSKEVAFLEEHSECGFVICQGELVSADNVEKPIGILKREQPAGEDHFFEDLICCRNVVFGPGACMVRSEAIRAAIPDLEIFENRQGQNWQLMLPIAYMYRCGYINEVLFRCVAHADSHSRQKCSLEQDLRRREEFIEICSKTIEKIPMMPAGDLKKYKEMIWVYQTRSQLHISLVKCSIKNVRKYCKVLRENGERIELLDYIIPYKVRSLFGKVHRCLKRKRG